MAGILLAFITPGPRTAHTLTFRNIHNVVEIFSNCNWQIICTIEIPNPAHTMLDWGLFQFKCTLSL